jgi:hypothetical protein
MVRLSGDRIPDQRFSKHALAVPTLAWVTGNCIDPLANEVGVAGMASVRAWPGDPGLGVAPRFVGLFRSLNVSGANETGEPNGEPMSADVRLRRATTSHSFRS